MNVNGFSTVSHPSTSGTFAPSSPPAGAPTLRTYDCLWDYAPFPPAGGLKDGSPAAAPPLAGLAQLPLNGGSRPASPGHGTNLRAAGPEFWGNGTAGPMGLNFDSQELYDSFHEPSFELMPNGPAAFYGAAQPSPMLASSTQPFALPPAGPGAGRGDADTDAKEMPPSMAENGAGLVGSRELEEEQPGRSLGRAGSAPGPRHPGPGGWVLDPELGRWSWASCLSRRRAPAGVWPIAAGMSLNRARRSPWQGGFPWGRWAQRGDLAADRPGAG